MKWGVRRNYDRSGGADGKIDTSDKLPRTKLGRKLNSLKRERQWKSVVKEMDKLSNDDIKEVTKRVTLENSLKKYSREIGTKKDKEEYLRRAHMSNEELSRKVTRLAIKSNFRKAVNEASKEQREFGEKVMNIGKSLGVRYVLNKKLTSDDIFDTLKNPKAEYDKAKGEGKAELEKRGRDLLKTALAKTKSKP